MERLQRVQKPPARRGCDYPSFSSSLLDSIYRSIDDETNYPGAPDSPTRKKKQSALAATPDVKWAPPVLTRVKPPHGTPGHPKRNAPAVTRPQQFHSTTSSSSDCSSYGGFSSSEPESAPVHPNRLKPIRTANFQARSNFPPPLPIPLPPEKKKKNLNSIRSKFRDLKKSRSPTSPAARLAGFLNSLFTSTAGTTRKQKIATASEESACSTASSYSRSCLVKTPSTAEHAVKRSVRFSLPVDGGNGRREEGRCGRREMKKMMTWRGFEDEDDDVTSDSSSDLFELENLSAIGRYRDELPVYETTHLGRLIL